MSDPAIDEVAVTLNERLRPLKVSEYVALAELGAFENERVELLRGRVVSGEWTEHFTLAAERTIRPVSFPDVEFPLRDFLIALPSH